MSFQPQISRTTVCNSLMVDFWHNSKFLYYRCFHAYKDIWEPVINQVLPCIQEPANPEDRNAVTLMNKEKIAGHVPKNISVMMTMFLKLKNSSIASRATGEEVNKRRWLWTGNPLRIFSRRWHESCGLAFAKG